MVTDSLGDQEDIMSVA